MSVRMRKAAVLEEFQWVGRELTARGLLTLHGGNLSLRSGNSIYITRTGSMLGRLVGKDIIETPADANKPPHPLASMELPTHVGIYQGTEARAVVHAHPPSAIALSFELDRILPKDSEGKIILGVVPVIREKQAVASLDVARRAAAYLRKHRAVVVATHGSFSIGRSLEEALSVTTTLEMSAKIVVMLRGMRAPQARRGGHKIPGQ